MNIDVFSYTHQGGRTRNEDALGSVRTSGGGVFALSDGLGGHGGGDVASQLVVDALLEGAGAQGALDAVLRQAHGRVLNMQSTSGYAQMRATAVVLRIAEHAAQWAHVGDSRLLRVRNSGIAQLTQDHSLTYKKYLSGQIERRQIATDEDRSRLLRALGGKGECVPDVGADRVYPGDGYVLCSDGFWEWVTEQEMLIDFHKARDAAAWAEFMLLRRLRKAEKDSDNFSVMTLICKAEGACGE